ncbi:MAG: GntR family transcriptional regulator [Planctomycetes bacterium]|nr:GntR family transcriptional regulator [Planctomycetota bacterium]
MTKKTSKSPQSMKNRAYSELLKRILSGDYAPGALLNRRGVAEELSMSPAPVHEAMIQLESDGLLEALPRHGTRVRTVRREDIRGHLIIREALESQAARMICGDPFLRQLEKLRPMAEAADSIMSPLSGVGFQDEVTFHHALVEIASCPALLREYRRVMQIGLFYHINLMVPRKATRPEYSHLSLLDNLAEASTPDVAAKCIRQHLWSGKLDFLNTTAGETPQYIPFT